jgi:hypothetical protein
MLENTLLESKSRELYGIVIPQMVNSEMLSISDLREAYTRARVQNGWADKTIESIAQGIQFRERIYFLLKEKSFINIGISLFMKNIEDKGFAHYMKELGVYKTTGRADNKKTYADPYLWVAFAMEMNPELYAKVIIWLTDGLIFERLEACNNNKVLNDKIKSIVNTNDYKPYSLVALAINKKILNSQSVGIRNTATKAQLRAINDLEGKLIFAIENSYITKFSGITQAIEKYILH